MALFRALESARPPGLRLFEDRFAAGFLAPRYRLAVGLSRLPLAGTLLRAAIDRRWPGARTSAVARTRFIDEAAAAGLASGIEQVVILGAGFDSRAYRLAGMDRAAVFEADHPATSAAKKTAVEVALGAVPAYVRLVPVDFGSASWPEAMVSAGYKPQRRTLFIWEGVTNYLSADAVDATLRWCAGSAPGGKVVFTYMDRKVLQAPEQFEGTKRIIATLAAAGERWSFGLDPPGLPGFLARRGLVLEEDVSASGYRARYFGLAAARMRGYEFYHVAVARVGESPSPRRNGAMRR
jgi:methyltransferase (TIGR00027 family)